MKRVMILDLNPAARQEAVADNLLDPVNIGMVLGPIVSTFTREDLAKVFQDR